MNIDWLWQPVPELRDLPQAEQKRIWRLCAGRAMLSWRFVVAMALNLLWTCLIISATGLALWSMRWQRIDASWLSLLILATSFVMLTVGSSVAMQPWTSETRRLIRAEQPLKQD